MRRIDEELNALGYRGIFFELPDRAFISSYEWGTLMNLVNEDYADLFARPPNKPSGTYEATLWLIHRIDRARKQVGIQFSVFSALEKLSCSQDRPCSLIAEAIGKECLDFVEQKWKNSPQSMEGKTVVIEFSLGGPHGAKLPLTGGYGYAYSYSCLSPEILEEAVVLYVHVTPATSRAKNKARGQEVGADDKPTGVQLTASLNHCVPDHVMWNAYGQDDIAYLQPGESVYLNTVPVKPRAGDSVCHLPLIVVENEPRDLTTFTHKQPSEWQEEEKAALRCELSRAFAAVL